MLEKNFRQKPAREQGRNGSTFAPLLTRGLLPVKTKNDNSRSIVRQ